MASRRLVRKCLEHPRVVLAAWLLVSIGWLPGLARLRIESDGRDLFAADHPAILAQNEVDERFASSDFLLIGLESLGPNDIFSPPALRAVASLTERLASLPGVEAEDVRSLSTEFSPEWSQGALRLEPPIATTVTDALEADAVRRRAEAEPLFDRVLLSSDRRGTAIYVPLAPGATRGVLVHAAEGLLAEEVRREPELASGYRFHLLGSAAAESLLGEHVLGDLLTLLPLALLVVAMTLWLWFRRLAVVVVGLGEGGAVVLAAMGLMAVLGRPLSLVTVVMPVILVTYCVADTVHVAQHFAARCRDQTRPGRVAAMEEVLAELVRPVVFTSVTTAAGFLAFAASPIPPLRDFGLFSAFGVLYALGISIFVVPTALVACGLGPKPKDSAGVAVGESYRLGGPLGRASLACTRRPLAVVLVSLLVTAVLGLGAFELEIQDSWLMNFDSDSELVQSDRWFNRNFFGSNVVNVVVTSPTGTVLDPVFLAELERFQNELGARLEVGGSRSIADSLRAVGRALEGQGRLPRDRRESEQWALLFRMAGGGRSLDAYIDADQTSANLWFFLNQADYRRTAAVIDAISRFDWRDELGSGPVTHLAGDATLGYRLVDSISRSQSSSAFAALVMTLLAVWWMLRSLGLALLAILPVALSVAWNFGLMGWLGIPLGVATSTFCAIAFGIGVDFALHWIARLEVGLERGLAWEPAVEAAGRGTGGAILLQGLVLGLGFSVLLFSAAPPNRQLAWVLGINLAACVGTSLVLLPAAARLQRRGILDRRAAVTRASALEVAT